MLSLHKLIVLSILLWLIWIVFRVFERRKAQATVRAQKNQHSDQAHKNAGSGGSDSDMDMVECTQCKAFVPERGCDRENCPVRG